MDSVSRRTKADVVASICDDLRIPEFRLSTGSTESKEFLVAVADQIGLGATVAGLSKPEICRTIVESFGDQWLPDYESRGSTVTLKGLEAIERVILRVAP